MKKIFTKARWGGNPAIRIWLMRINLLIILLTLFASTYAIETAAQRVTLKANKLSLTEILASIRTQTGYDVLMSFDAKIIQRDISIQVKDRLLQDVLPELLKGTHIVFEINDEKKAIILTERPVKNESAHLIRAYTEVRGRVTDTLGQPLVGASIRVINADGQRTTLQTTTDRVGEFRLHNVPEDAQLEISYVGYITLQVRAASNIGQVVLRAESSALEEVEVNAGYYTVTERESTGNIVRVSAKDIENQPLTSPIVALQGRIAGVEITQLSGMPGAAPSIQIRGRNSIRYDANDPLYIIDGVPVDASAISTSGFLLRIGTDPLSSLNLSNIESVEVLKDADATAIYGSRGANGVILITTKKGKQGKATLEINAYTGVGKVPYFMDLLNTEQYVEMRREAFANTGGTPTAANAVDLMVWDTTRYTDWQKELIGGTAGLTNVQASVSGGSAQTSYRVGGSFQKQGTVFPADIRYQKITGFLNLNHRSPNDKLRASLSTSYGSDNNLLFPGGSSELANAVFLPPNAPALYDESGNLNWENSTWNNPVAAMQRPQRVKNSSITLNSQLSYELLTGLRLKASLGYTSLNINELLKSPKSSFNPMQTNASEAYMRSTVRDSWIIEPQIDYTRVIGGGALDILLGGTLQSSINEGLSMRGTGFVDESLMENIGTADNVLLLNTFTGKTEYMYTAVFGRFAYNWQQKYFLNLTGRRDGSSRFGPGKRFANFGAVGAAWIFSEEPFMKDVLSFINFGKLRTSYGLTGSDQIGDYGYLDTWGTTDGEGGLYPTKLANPDYSWETNKKFEAAMELGFINDRLQISTSWYKNRSSNQLVGYPLAYTTGFTSVQANLGATVENKGWEFELNTVNVQSSNFRWSSSANISFHKNKLIEFPDIEQTSYANNYVVGEPLSIQFQYQYTGLDPETGLYTVLDVSEDGRYDADDKIVYTNVARDYFGGVNNGFSYKNFQLDFLVTFVKHTAAADARFLNNAFAPGSLGGSQSPGSGSMNIQANVLTVLMDRWQHAGDNTNIQKFVQGSGDTRYYSYARSSTAAYNSDASFFRLKTLSLSYQLPKSLISKAGLGSCKVYIQGQNLFTVTNYLGWDPQSPYTGALPALRMITGGIQLQF